MFVMVDQVANTDAAKADQIPFIEVKDAHYAEVLRGVSFTPGSDLSVFKHF